MAINNSLYITHLLSNLCAIGQPSGLNAARKLRNTRREQRWADKQYKKRALGTAFRSNPFGGASHAKGIVLEKM
jgi:small subunit ribosomal protein S23e